MVKYLWIAPGFINYAPLQGKRGGTDGFDLFDLLFGLIRFKPIL
jgi:hypothetical protein